MKIGPFDLARRVLVIAEIGNNHEGDFERACAMVSSAAASGAHAVKFQTMVPEKVVASSEEKRIALLKRH